MVSGPNNGQTCAGVLSNSSMGTQAVGGSAKIRLICSSCNQEFATTSELNDHMERHNSEIDQAILQQTSSSISLASSNMVPMSVSSTYTLTQPRSLITTTEIHHTCSICGAQFRNQISLNNHQKS